MVKHRVVCRYSERLLSSERGKLLLTRNDLDVDIEGIVLSEKKPVSKDYILCDSIYMTF